MPDSIQPTNPDTAVPENASDLEAKVAARAAAIEAKVADKIPAPPKETKLPKDFVLDCLNRNKVGDAALFCALFRGKYVFVQEWEKFLYWSGHFWQVDMRSKRALADSERVCEAYMNAWAECNDEEGSPLHKKILKRLDSLRSPKGRKDMLECVTTIDDAPVISYEQLDKQPYLLATPTGVVDLRTGECSPGKPEQYLLSHCPTPWRGIDEPCREFEEYLQTCMDDDHEIKDFIQRLLGYALLGEKKHHIWVIMYGPLSRNGKDTLMNIVKRILGKNLHVRIPTNMLMDQKFERDSSQPSADMMALRGAKIAYASEAKKRHSLDQAKIKDMTGGGYITARGLTDREMTEWKQSALIMLLTNYLPKINSDDDGFNARTICIEWPVKFVPNPVREYERKIVYGMDDRLEKEDSGILAFMVRGCMDVIANNLRIPDKVLRYTADQIDSFDDIGKFLKECCILEDPPTGGREFKTRTAASDLLKICNWWCKNILGNSYPFTPKQFAPALEKKGIPTKKSSIMYYLGVTVKEEIEDEFEEAMRNAESKKQGK
jgi:phage/plasmid primase, P4 family, C-terminal domain